MSDAAPDERRLRCPIKERTIMSIAPKPEVDQLILHIRHQILFQQRGEILLTIFVRVVRGKENGKAMLLFPLL
jgi:hypothetical protein